MRALALVGLLCQLTGCAHCESGRVRTQSQTICDARSPITHACVSTHKEKVFQYCVAGEWEDQE